MGSNSSRTKQQLFTIPAVISGMAVVAWPVSYGAATATGWVSAPTGTFTDFWMGAASVITGLGAFGLTCAAIGTLLDGLWTWLRD